MRHFYQGVVALLVVLFCMPTVLADDTVETSSMQAAYVYNFMLLAKWPQPSSEKRLCIAGQNRESLLLKSLDGREAGDAKLKVLAVNGDADLSACHALFVASTEFSHLFDRALGKPILALSNIQPDNGRVSALRLYSVGGRVVFDVDLPTLTKSQVHLGASVLRLARETRE